MRAFFYDTWAFAALLNRRDGAHAVAARLDRELEAQGYVATTTDYVVDETVTLLQSGAGSHVALRFLELLLAREAGRDLLLFEVSGARRQRSVDVFRQLAPAEPHLSFTDATSFAVMAEMRIELAFTADRHFQRAGHGIRPLVARRGSGWHVAALT